MRIQIGALALRSCQITTMAQKIRDTRVDIAAPSTPMPSTKIKIAFPPMFIKLEITEMIIGLRLLFWERIIEAPASYSPINGNDNRVKKK